MVTTAGPRAAAGEQRLAWLAHPARFQQLFGTLYGLDVGLRLAFGGRFGLLSWPAAGVALVALMMAAAPLVPWGRLDPRVVMVLPVADIAAVGLGRLTPEGGNGLLVVFPALWLGRQWGRTGAVVATVATVGFVVVPGGVYAGGDPALLSRALFFPVVAAVTALVIAVGMEQVRDQHSQIERQRRISQAIFDSTDVGLLLLDEDGSYLGMNRRHLEFMTLAYPEGHRGRAGQVGAVFAADGQRPLCTEELPAHRASQGEEFDDVRIWVGSDPAARRALSVSARAVRDADGRLAGAALAYTDVTDIMRALQVKDDFVALVSHELRTPLTSIIGYVEILEDDPRLPPSTGKALRVVHRNADRLQRLIGDLLDTAQRDGRPMPITRAPTDLAAIVREAVEAAQPAAVDSRVRLLLEAPDRLPVAVDAQRMAQVVDNLVSNAVKYTEPGGRVEVSLATRGDRVVLEVCDTGIGIPEDDLARLFTRFFRTDDAARRAIVGAGLGLSITKDIVESHGGRIEVRSRVGEGSTFLVSLPTTP